MCPVTTLFNKVLETVVWGLLGRPNELDYADDICLLEHSYSDLAANLHSVTLTAESASLKINVLKTKTLRIYANCLDV